MGSREMSCKHAYKHDKRMTPNEADRKRDRMSKKTDCPVRMRINERPDGRWELRWMSAQLRYLRSGFLPQNI
jgi:IS5 family transposase